MTGMKQGASDDPFADDENNADDESTEAAAEAEATTETPPLKSDRPTADHDSDASRDHPYMLIHDTVKEDRDNEHIYSLRDEFAGREDEVHEAVAEILGKRTRDVYLTDVREAIVAATDPEDVAEVLRDWGIDAK